MKPIKTTFGTLTAIIALGCSSLTVFAQSHSNSPEPASPSAAAVTKSASAHWLTDFKAGQQQAKAEGKYTLLDFTGSDWCGWCMKLDSEIFSTPEFQKFADKRLVLVKVDFPMEHPQPADEKAQNEKLAAKFQVEGFPTLIILDPNGHQVGTLGYTPGGPQALIDQITHLIPK